MTEVCSPNKVISLTVALETTSSSNTLGTYSRIMESTTPHALRKSVNRASKSEVFAFTLPLTYQPRAVKPSLCSLVKGKRMIARCRKIVQWACN